MGFFAHAIIYVLMNTLLMVINLAFVPEYIWFFYPLIAWDIGLLMHYLYEVRFVRRIIETGKQRLSTGPEANPVEGSQPSLASCDCYVAATRHHLCGSHLHDLCGACVCYAKSSFFSISGLFSVVMCEGGFYNF
jgi:hypothetical protein